MDKNDYLIADLFEKAMNDDSWCENEEERKALCRSFMITLQNSIS